MAKISQNGNHISLPQLKIQKKLQSVEFQNKSFTPKKNEQNDFVDDIRNSIFNKLNKSLDDTHIKTYTVEQILKFPFFEPENMKRKKELNSVVTSTLSKNIK